jgi:hypothetical protein
MYSAVVRSFTADLQMSFAASHEHIRLLARAYQVPVQNIRQATELEDMRGIDYFLYDVPGESEPVTVDIMQRSWGAMAWWQRWDTPELAIEIANSGGGPGKYGNGAKPRDYAFTFQDVPGSIFIVSGQELRDAVAAGAFDDLPIRRPRTAWGDVESVTPVRFVPFTEMKARGVTVREVPAKKRGPKPPARPDDDYKLT